MWEVPPAARNCCRLQQQSNLKFSGDSSCKVNFVYSTGTNPRQKNIPTAVSKIICNLVPVLILGENGMYTKPKKPRTTDIEKLKNVSHSLDSFFC